jgi:putative addiction module component (TIGR02574 family)
MERKHEELLEDAMRLPAAARAALAASLIESLDEEVDQDVEAAWQAEISRRLREVREGKVNLLPWSEGRRKITGG